MRFEDVCPIEFLLNIGLPKYDILLRKIDEVGAVSERFWVG